MRKALLAALAVALFLVPPASAELDNPDCTAIIQGIDIADRPADRANAIKVGAGDDVSFRLTSETLVEKWQVRLHYGAISFPVRTGEPTSDSGDRFVEEDTIGADTYSWMGRGLIRLSADIIRQDGTRCHGEILIDIEGSPAASLLGVLSILMILGGIAAFTMSFIQNSRPEKATRAPPGPGRR